MIYINDDIDGGEDEMEDDDAVSLADDILDEVDGDEEDLADEIEGFGILDEAGVEEEEEEESDEVEGDESLEEDAEDVDYDSFDDIDEM
jgi:hypothetical protein